VLFLIFGALFLLLWAALSVSLPLLRRAGALVARVLARASARWSRIGTLSQRFDPYLPVALVVVAGAFLTAWAGDNFLDLGELVHAKNASLQQFDGGVHAWAVSQRSASSTLFFLLMTTVGSPVTLGLISGWVSVGLVATRRFRWALYFVVTVGGGALLNLELKRYFARARPAVAEMLRQAHGYSFPSGHAMGSTVVFGALSYLAFRTVKGWRWKAAALAFAATLAVGISLSRVYLGVHWISDVAAGVLAGSMWVGITTVSYETLRRLRMLRYRVRGSG